MYYILIGYLEMIFKGKDIGDKICRHDL